MEITEEYWTEIRTAVYQISQVANQLFLDGLTGPAEELGSKVDALDDILDRSHWEDDLNALPFGKELAKAAGLYDA